MALDAGQAFLDMCAVVAAAPGFILMAAGAKLVLHLDQAGRFTGMTAAAGNIFTPMRSMHGLPVTTFAAVTKGA